HRAARAGVPSWPGRSGAHELGPTPPHPALSGVVAVDHAARGDLAGAGGRAARPRPRRGDALDSPRIHARRGTDGARRAGRVDARVHRVRLLDDPPRRGPCVTAGLRVYSWPSTPGVWPPWLVEQTPSSRWCRERATSWRP